jgi:hypothetical protein
MQVTEEYRGWEIVSQNPEYWKEFTTLAYLNTLLDVCEAIENATGHKWMITSFLRDSPSHRRSVSIDLAPLISAASSHLYAVTNGSDPVLYKREPLIRSLQDVCRMMPTDMPFDIGIFIEPDHLHVQAFTKENPTDPSQVRLYKWKQPKPVYSDTHARMLLPMTSTCYPTPTVLEQ